MMVTESTYEYISPYTSSYEGTNEGIKYFGRFLGFYATAEKRRKN